ncbi:MAG: YfiR family protein [Pseudomonadota bacterium]
MRAILSTLATAAMILASLTGWHTPAAAQSRTVEQLEAAIIFKILKFVDLPKGGAEPFIFCVESGAASAPALLSLRGQRVRDHRLGMRLIRNRDFAGCDIVYLERADAAVIQNARSPGRLVMGRGTRFIDANGTIGLVQTGNQIRFEVNLEEADRAGLKISSRLVRLAARVER